jgi:hypothetical protein
MNSAAGMGGWDGVVSNYNDHHHRTVSYTYDPQRNSARNRGQS